jgi:Cu-Zn family superoxide dismutase
MKRALWGALVGAGLAACGGGHKETTEGGATTQPAPASEAPAPASMAPAGGGNGPGAGGEAHATINPASGSDVHGTATLKQEGDKVMLRVEARGLTPGKHGLHIHETGDCSAPDAASAGGHFNPGNEPHGAPDAPQHHAGDFDNIDIKPDGTGTLELSSDRITLGEGPNSVIGKAIIIHGGVDDLTSQPAGNAGPRIGCGVIEAGPPTP